MFYRCAIVGAVTLLFAVSSHAQEYVADGRAIVVVNEPAIGCGHWIGADLLIGTPTAIRLQVAGFLQRERSTLAIDFLIGGLATREDVVSGVIGGGPRLLWNLFDDGQANVFQVNPGCYFLGAGSHDRGGLLIAPTVDLIWMHDFNPRCGWHIGTELGAGVDSRGGGFPVMALFTGLRF